MKKPWAVLATAVLTLGLAAAAPSSATADTPLRAPSAPSAPPAAERAYTPPAIDFGVCDDPRLAAAGAECGQLVVPLDYAKPQGRTVSLAVSRLRHKTPDTDYQGIMLVNPGGPGGSGLGLSRLQGAIPDGAGNSYDWIGFDPRGVGASRPSLTCNRFYNRGDRPPYRPTTDGIYKKWIARSKAYARKCADAPGSQLFGHLTTLDTVRDMNVMRKALGEKQINFYGFSYGTTIAQLYATRYPDQVRRFVLDGTVDPTRSVYESNQDQDRAFQKTFSIYTRWLAKYSDTYDVGDTAKQVQARYFKAIRDLDRRAAGGVLGGDELTDVFTSAGYYVYGWEDIAQAWSAYVNDGDASGLIDLYGEDTSPGADNGTAVYLGTQCTDQPWPRSQARLNRDNAKLYRNGSTFLTWSNAWFNGPCAYWKFAPRAAKAPVKGGKVKTPILLIGETYDAATPFSGSLTARQMFPQARLIEGKNGSTHAGSLSGVACTDDAIAAYLADGTLFPRVSGNRADKVCPPVPRPDPTAPGRRAGSDQDQVLRDLHEQIARIG